MAVMRDDGSEHLLMKTMQESLRDGDRRFESTVTVYKVWLSWEEKLHKFWEGQSKLKEGKEGMLCTFSRRNSQQGLDSQICAIFQRNELG